MSFLDAINLSPSTRNNQIGDLRNENRECYVFATTGSQSSAQNRCDSYFQVVLEDGQSKKMVSDYFVSHLFETIDDYIWTNLSLDVEPRLLLEAFLACLALAYSQLLLVRFGFWIERRPFPIVVLDPFLAITLPLTFVNYCTNLFSSNSGDHR